jgi:general secretion pathway protein A
MEYYKILNFKKDPFSNSPEPEFFFEAPKHISCLQKLELAVRLRRGLNVVIGAVGTGKTTLCRKLIQQLSFAPKDSQDIETYLLLDPSFDSIIGFLQTISLLIGLKDLDGQENEWQLKEKIKNYLFNKGVNDNKIVVLIIDEGQKIPESCIEILREFLNYETNNFKLLQIIIFAQLEFKKVLRKYANLSDRINYLYYLTNLKFKHMRDMIKYRISVARNFEKSSDLFTFWGMLAIYLATRGYPRKVVSLCHQALLMLIIRGKDKADFFLVRDCINDMYSPLFRRLRWIALSAALIISAGAFVMQDPTATINFYKQLSVPQIMSQAQQLLSTPKIPAPPVKTSSAAVPAITSETQQIPSAQVTPAPSINPVSPPVPATNSPAQQIPPAPDTPAASIKTLPLPAPAIIPENKIQEMKMPASLGILTMKKGRTFWRTITNIYGEMTSEIIEKVNKANPHINNKNAITVGGKINLPSIPVNIRPFKEGNFIVVLEKGNNIRIMYDFFHENTYKNTLPPLLFFPYWNSKEGMTFAVILDTDFSNPQAAKEAINVLPAAMAAKAQIISQWDKTSVFFNRQALKN